MNRTPSRNWLPSVLFVPGLLWPLALSAPAWAQDVATAEALFTRGMADMDTGRYETGCKAIAESQRLDPRPGTLFTLAVCEMQWGKIATAASHYGDYLSLYERLTPDQKARQKTRPKEAKAQREALLPRVPELTVVLPPGAPAGTVVKRNGAVMADAALGIGLPVDPGEHVVTTQAPGGLAAANSGKTLALVSTIGFGVGLAGIGTAAVLFLTEPKRAKPADTASRRWITAGVLEEGPAGAMVGARGRW